jgi:hypothetical protein
MLWYRPTHRKFINSLSLKPGGTLSVPNPMPLHARHLTIPAVHLVGHGQWRSFYAGGWMSALYRNMHLARTLPVWRTVRGTQQFTTRANESQHGCVLQAMQCYKCSSTPPTTIDKFFSHSSRSTTLHGCNPPRIFDSHVPGSSRQGWTILKRRQIRVFKLICDIPFV